MTVGFLILSTHPSPVFIIQPFTRIGFGCLKGGLSIPQVTIYPFK
jgi:hypothetical protein